MQRPFHASALAMINEVRGELATHLEPGLSRALSEANSLCSAMGGELVSRQAIAAVIVAWQLANPHREPTECR